MPGSVVVPSDTRDPVTLLKEHFHTSRHRDILRHWVYPALSHLYTLMGHRYTHVTGRRAPSLVHPDVDTYTLSPVTTGTLSPYQSYTDRPHDTYATTNQNRGLLTHLHTDSHHLRLSQIKRRRRVGTVKRVAEGVYARVDGRDGVWCT